MNFSQPSSTAAPPDHLPLSTSRLLDDTIQESKQELLVVVASRRRASTSSTRTSASATVAVFHHSITLPPESIVYSTMRESVAVVWDMLQTREERVSVPRLVKARLAYRCSESEGRDWCPRYGVLALVLLV